MTSELNFRLYTSFDQTQTITSTLTQFVIALHNKFRLQAKLVFFTIASDLSGVFLRSVDKTNWFGWCARWFEK